MCLHGNVTGLVFFHIRFILTFLPIGGLCECFRGPSHLRPHNIRHTYKVGISLMNFKKSLVYHFLMIENVFLSGAAQFFVVVVAFLCVFYFGMGIMN